MFTDTQLPTKPQRTERKQSKAPLREQQRADRAQRHARKERLGRVRERELMTDDAE